MDPLNTLLQAAGVWIRPLQSLLVALATALALQGVAGSRSAALRRLLPGAVFLVAAAIHWVAQRHPGWSLWLYRLEHPLVPAFFLLVLPALLLHGHRLYPLFLLWPASLLAGLVLHIRHQLLLQPPGSGFVGFPSAPVPLALGLVAFLVLIHPVLPLRTWRVSVRLTALVLLLWGGFLFRTSPADFERAMARRASPRNDLIAFSETTPVLYDPERLVYLPAAPCRFSADGGYVQGCGMELLQRLAQLDTRAISSGALSERALLAVALGALASLSIALFLAGRWWCGWVCPLATLGDVLDALRRRLHLPHVKTSPTAQRAAFWSGLSLGSFGLLMAAAVPRLDAQGRFLGCKIPLYPFCKICPAQQICPVAARGPTAYPPLPGREWLGGFFGVAALALLIFFVAAFALSRRLFCRFCPMGLLGGPFNNGGLLALRKRPVRCNRCGLCRDVCPVDIPTVAAEMKRSEVAHWSCHYCLKCVEWCPQPDCLRAEFAGRPILRSHWP